MKIEKAAKLLSNKTHAINDDCGNFYLLKKVLKEAFPNDPDGDSYNFSELDDKIYGFNRHEEGQWANIGSYLKKLEYINLSEIELIETEKTLNKPTHYKTDNNIDVIDFCKMYNLNFNLGNVVKYVSRAGKKDDEIKDLEKALDFIQREIKYLKEK